MLLKHLLLERSPYNNPVKENTIYSFSVEEDTERLERLCHLVHRLEKLPDILKVIFPCEQDNQSLCHNLTPTLHSSP